MGVDQGVRVGSGVGEAWEMEVGAGEDVAVGAVLLHPAASKASPEVIISERTSRCALRIGIRIYLSQGLMHQIIRVVCSEILKEITSL